MSRIAVYRIAGASVIALGLAVPAAAQESSGITGQILSIIGLTAPEPPAIDYRERAPLVVPREMKLRPPEQRRDAQANPAWPKDPDVERRRREAQEARIPVLLQPKRRDEDRPVLSDRELRQGRKDGAGVVTAPERRFGDSSREEFWIRPDVLRSQGVANAGPALAPGAEPPRTSLTDPPAGYRAPNTGFAVRDTTTRSRRSAADDGSPRDLIRQQQGLPE
jgi:hypothetical protein